MRVRSESRARIFDALTDKERMRFELIASLVSVVVLAAGAPRPAQACGASPSPYWTLAGSVPEDKAVGVPRDLGIVLITRAWINEPGGPGFPYDSHSVRLYEAATDTEVPIHADISWMSDRPTNAWRPDAPLAPDTEYRVEAMLADQGPLPAEVSGPTELTFTFTTGADLAPAIEVAGELAMELEAYDEEQLDCGPCGNGTCVPAGTVRRVRARVTIPALSGGFGDDGYRGWLAVRPDVPATFAGPGEPSDGSGLGSTSYVSIVPGAPTVVYVPLSELDRTYRPCFSLGAWDPGGHMSPVAPVCFDAVRPADLLASDVPPLADAGSAVTLPPRADASCAVTQRGAPGVPWSVALAFTLAATRLRRRSRQVR